jgi:hypothetical protein
MRCRDGAIALQSCANTPAIGNFPMAHRGIPDTEHTGKQGYSHFIVVVILGTKVGAGGTALPSSNEEPACP